MLSGDTAKLEPRKKRSGLLGEDLSDNQFYIGFAENPIMLCTREEARELIDSTFYQLYDIWENLHYGGFWPIEPQRMDSDIVKAVIEMEKYYQRHFSIERVQVTYLEALLKRR